MCVCVCQLIFAEGTFYFIALHGNSGTRWPLTDRTSRPCITSAAARHREREREFARYSITTRARTFTTLWGMRGHSCLNTSRNDDNNPAQFRPDELLYYEHNCIRIRLAIRRRESCTSLPSLCHLFSCIRNGHSQNQHFDTEWKMWFCNVASAKNGLLSNWLVNVAWEIESVKHR